MTEQDRPQARHIDSLKQEELDQLIAVPGWRIWTFSIHAALDTEYMEALERIQQNPSALVITESHRGHDQIDEKLFGVRIPFKMVAFDVWQYILEPLDQETVTQIVEQEEELKRLVRPEEFRNIVGS